MGNSIFILLAALFVLVWLGFGAYAAQRCGQSAMEGVVHAFFLGPFGILLVALYPARSQLTYPWDVEPKSEPFQESGASDKTLTAILAELKWQRHRKEKEIVRAKAAQAAKKLQDTPPA